MKFVPEKFVTLVCDGCKNCQAHCECGPNQTPAPCDLKFAACSKCNAFESSIIPPLKYYKVSPHAFAPTWGTAHSACFDLRACLRTGDYVNGFKANNQPSKIEVYDNCISIHPGQRLMIPTGLMFDIPVGYSVRLHCRSGLAVKQGLVLANHEGIIDSDYCDPTFMVMHNTSLVWLVITHGDRLAQGEMIPDMSYEVNGTLEKPQQKTDRAGGFGSTGVK